MAINVNTNGGSFNSIKVNGCSINDPRFDRYIDSEGIFSWKGVTIKPSGSVRIGSVKIHPSGLIQFGDAVNVEGSILPNRAATGTTVSKTSGTTSNQSKSRTVLSESSNKANVQSKKVAGSSKDSGVTGSKSAGSENQAQSAGNKRKSTEVAPESAKKQKTSSEQATTTSVENRTATASVPSAPQNIDEVVLDGQYYDDIAVHESCDQIRRKIEAHLSQPGVTKAQFCRDMDGQLYSASRPTKIQSKMLDDFRKKHGPSHGCTSSVYYAAYVFFEKWRIVGNEAKSKHRLEMEKIWPGGTERDRDDSTRGMWCGPNERPRQDSYGRWKFH